MAIFASNQDNEFVVRTANSTYRLGRPTPDGRRQVSRDGKFLRFKECRIICLAEGERMILEIIGAVPGSDPLSSTPVDSVTVV